MVLLESRRVGALALVCAALVGCSEKLESADVTVDSVQPNLVCNARRLDPDAFVSVSGTGFAPMPRDVLARPVVLVLPEVTLTRSQSLTGGSESGEIVFPSEPGETFSNNVEWLSGTEMRLRISEEPLLDVAPGIYDVTVENPDGDKAATLARSLAVVPPPTIASVAPVPQARCVAQGAKEFVITGENFLVVDGVKPTVTVTLGGTPSDIEAGQLTMDGCSAVPGTFAGGTVELCTTITAAVAGLDPGAYEVKVTSPAPAACESEAPPTLLIVPPPFVTAITPQSICVDQAVQTVSITGGNFARINVGDHTGEVPTVTVSSADGAVTHPYTPDLTDCAPPEGVDAAFGVEICNTMTFTVPIADLPAGAYTVTVGNPEPIGCESEEPIDLTVNAAPLVSAVNPGLVCTGGSVVSVTGTGFLAGATARLECGSQSIPANGVEIVDATTANITFGAGINVGEVCDLVFQNQDGCDDRPLPHQTVTGTQGPILFNVDPNIAFNGVSTRAILHVTAIDGLFTVTMWPDGGDPTAATELVAALALGKTNVIQATIPAGTAAGLYTLSVQDQSGCLASMASAVQVVDMTTVATGTVTPSFGQQTESKAITITLGADPLATGIPRAFLNPVGTSAAPSIPLRGLTVIDATTLTAVVPADTPPGVYDLIIVWPDGAVAVISNAYTSVAAEPPQILTVTPQSIVAQGGQAILVDGRGFVGSDVTLQCQTVAGAIVDIDATEQTEVCASGACTQQATLDGTPAGEGAVCVVRVTNDDGSYADYSAIAVTNSSLNLSASPELGTPLNTARRGLVSAGVQASSAARFVFAIGGDDGAIANAFDTVEFAPVDIFGNMQAWEIAAETMTSPRSFAGSTTLGRYIYVIGGNGGAGTLGTAERALVLSPDEIPEIVNVDLCLAGGTADCFGVAGLADGLEAGVYSYRVSAIIDAADPVNLGGETLASDPTILRLQTVDDRNVTTRIEWEAPVDAQGNVLSGITGYRVYRTPLNGAPGADELLLAEVAAATLTYIDDGSDALGTEAPLLQGSTSAWQALPALSVPREGVGVTSAMDPATPDTWHVYALLGQDAGTGHTSYEYLTVTEAVNGRQTVGGAWTAVTAALDVSNQARWNHGVWRVDDSVLPTISTGETYIYVGPGSTSPTAETGTVEVATVNAGGQLSPFDDAGVTDFGPGLPVAGYGAPAIGSSDQARLFAFGGIDSTPVDTIRSGGITTLPDIGWNAEGGVSLVTPRAFMGMALQSAHIFLIGGTSTGADALASTETVVW